MKTLKKLLLGLGAVIVVFLLTALFLPSTYHVERSIVINQPVDKVYPQVANLNNWTKWNPWTEMEPTAKNEVKGSGKEIGSVWTWKGNIIGTGSLTLKELQPNHLVRSQLVFTAPQSMESEDIWYFNPTSNGTEVTWAMEGKLEYPYPVNRYFGLLMDGMLGPDFEKGLYKLKIVTEAS